MFIGCVKNNGTDYLQLKYISTVGYQPERLAEWANRAMRIVQA